ncbi:MAG: OsmC family protein [Ardenticatenaceae bacterium]|nr:OsmC family protein [Ardenticatenaceae bacterium]
MTVRSAEAVWNGTLREGNGVMKMKSGAYEGPYTFASRFEEGEGTNPEELVAAAHAGCFSMALSADLGRAGHTAGRISTTAKVHLGPVDGKPTVHTIELFCEAEVPNLDDEAFQTIAAGTKQNCPISRLLAAAEIKLEAKLV